MSLTVSAKDWDAYIKRLAALNEAAAEKMREYVREHGFGDMNALIDYAYALVTKYGEGSAALSAAMYDAVAEMSGKLYDPAVPAETADYQTVARTVQGVARTSQNPDAMGSAVGRMVKQAGADTTLRNALRDGAEFAWVPAGDTCAFCLTLASRGWQRASKKAVKGGHAEHIHSNCDCTYAIRFDGKGGVAGYDPDKYRAMYDAAEGDTPQEKINAMRRAQYAENRDEINAQKRAAYAERKEREKGLSESGGSGIIAFEKDIHIGNSVGAKLKDTLVTLPNGDTVRLTPGTAITQVQTIAGAGRERGIDELPILISRYPGTKEELWQKRKGVGYVDYDGESFRAALHWYEEPSVGRVEFKVKPDAGGNWFYED